MKLSRSEARQLAIKAVEAGARVLQGVVTLGPEGVKVDGKDITEWLTQHAGTELMLIAAPVSQIIVEPELKTCYTCGEDYKGDICPRCQEARARLRGESNNKFS
jgi:hypothetical protein